MGVLQARSHHCVDKVVNDLCLGHYEHALRQINEDLDGLQKHEEIMALLELKNILLRLRLKGEAQRTIGPTRKSDALPHKFTLEMLDVVQKVLRCRNHYEVLRISHHATYSEVKRAYHKLALRLHPDKNKSPGAEQAFRRISEAADCLTDCQKRIEYNIATAVGDCHDQDPSQYKDYSGESEMNEANMNDLGAAFRRPYRGANQRMPQRQSLYQTQQLVIGVVAALVFLFVTMYFIAAAPAYSFTLTRTHSARRLSQTNHIAYYMNPTTLSKYTEQQLAELEVEIEEVYISDLKQKCRQERSWRDILFLRARQGNNDEKLLQHVSQMSTPACQALLQLGKSGHSPLQLENESSKQDLPL
ncbi:dnaJ homolog subfamily B member 14 [Drosophila mauritiana]|uniref:DnaJ homolog subfamily B member 14 n=1 Tax=Drosophila mauritiana TaxID=7226 RepID=A0A6P8JJV5_DROMA|nr:dnaJ homolog subfamily B member 14 [Drosophila mauritiana]